MRTIIRASLLAVPAAVLLAACGGSDGTTTPAAATTTTVSGSAVKGPVNGATVTARKPDGAACGSTTTNASGTYSLQTTCTGDLVIEVSGGTYTDEATNVPTSLSTPMRVVVVANGGAVTGIATPLTTLAYTYAASSGTVTHAAFTTQATNLAGQFGLSGVNLATTLPQVTGTTNAYGDSLRALSRYMADNGKTLATITNGTLMANATDLSSFNTLYNNALAAVGSPVRVTFTANGFNISGTGAGGGSGTCGVNERGTVSVSANGININQPIDLNFCVSGIAAGSCTSGNASLSQALSNQPGVTGAANLAYSYSASCAAGAIVYNLL
jgi:hypothetical protein